MTHVLVDDRQEEVCRQHTIRCGSGSPGRAVATLTVVCHCRHSPRCHMCQAKIPEAVYLTRDCPAELQREAQTASAPQGHCMTSLLCHFYSTDSYAPTTTHCHDSMAAMHWPTCQSGQAPDGAAVAAHSHRRSTRGRASSLPSSTASSRAPLS